MLSRLYGHHVDVLHIHDRIIVVAGATAGSEIPVLVHGSLGSRSELSLPPMSEGPS